MQPACTAFLSSFGPDQIKTVHQPSGHPGVRQTLLREADWSCSAQGSHKNYRQGVWGVSINWPIACALAKGHPRCWAMDITHYNSDHFVTLINCGPTHFTIWWRLHQQDTASVTGHLKVLCYEQGPLAEILTENDTAFCSKLFRWFLDM